MKAGTKSRLWTFEEALTLACDEGQPLSRAVVTFLSGAGRGEVARFAKARADLHDDRDGRGRL